MNVLLLASHAVAEHDDLEMLGKLGYDVFSPGGYADPHHPLSDLRPALDLPYHLDLDALCHAQRAKHEGESDAWAIDWAKADLHPDLLDWADVVICHHYPERWLASPWKRFAGKRVIWRTCGQSNPDLERLMGTLKGLEIVRYSPAERRAFEKIGAFAGEDAMIRFGKDPEEWEGWRGDDPVVGNVTQDMVGRADFCGLRFWRLATDGLPVKPAGAGSEQIGGVGALTYQGLREYLRSIRVYLYTGTQPASYTLGLIEAMMTGVPVVSIGPSWMWSPDLFEGHEIAPLRIAAPPSDPVVVRSQLRWLLDWAEDAALEAERMRARAIALFGIDTIGRQWREYLGAPRLETSELLMATNLVTTA